MDLFSSRGAPNTHKSDNKEFHYSPAHGPEDVVCGGSDTEQTEDEIRRKRRRYEDQARRYLDGHFPILQSASLRGPLDKESGWENPWRYQTTRNRGWWRPGAKDMLFTKSNVLKRAADHSLEHLSPADALSWCKSTAEAEAESIAGNGIKHTKSESSSMRDEEEEEQWHSEHRKILDKEIIAAQDIATPYAFKTGQAEDGTGLDKYTEEATRGIKRPVDSNWLKGSYVSKRARWDGPTISTPTPIPDVHGRRRQHTRSKLMDIGKQQQAVLNPELLPRKHSEGSSTVHKSSQRPLPNVHEVSSASSKERAPSMRSSFTPDAQRVAWDMGQSERRLQDGGELDESQEHSTMGLEPHLRSESQKGTALDRPCTNLEWSIPAMESSSSPKRLNKTPTIHKNSLDANSSLGVTTTLPRLPRDNGSAIHERQRSVSSVEEVSFVTEVVPSSRNLEEFQFRKKRSKVEHITAADSPYHYAHTSTIVSMAEEVSQDHKPQANLEPATAHELDELVFSPQLEGEMITSSANQRSSSPSRSVFASYYDERDISLLQTPHVPRILNNPPLLPELATFASPFFFQGDLDLASPKPGIIPPNPQQSSYSAARSQVLPSHTLPVLPTATPESPVNIPLSHEISRAVRPCDSSTQSYNTTPIRSGKCVGSSQTHKTHNQIVEEVADDTIGEPLASVDSDYRTTRTVDYLDVVASKKGDREVLLDEGLSQQDLDQQLQIQSVLSPQLKSDEALLGHHSVNEASFERIQLEEAAVKEVQPDHEQKELRDEDSVSRSQDHMVGNGTYREGSLDVETDAEDLESHPNLHSENDLQSNSDHPEESLGASALQNDHDMSSVDVAEKKAPSPAHVSLDLSTERSIESDADDVEVTGSIRPDNDSPKTPRIASQVLGPEEQSPWASVKIEPISKSIFMERKGVDEDDTESTSSYDNIILQLEEDDQPNADAHDEDLSWQHIERAPTPDGEEITPFTDIVVPPSPASSSHSPEALPSTQLLLEAALKNPWGSNSKTKGSEKSRKRVSFGMLPIDRNKGKENSLAESTPIPKRVSRSPPPQESTELVDEDSWDDTPIVVNFGDHFSTTGRQRLIPERNSQMNSSPAVGAQAQAFIAADREVSEKQEDHKTLPIEPSRFRQPRNEAMDNSVWQDSVREEDPFEKSSFISSEGLMDPFAAPTFDMEDVLGKAGDFLEDWSVDAEIKKAKEMNSSKDIESNGAKRRKLFGIV